MCGGIRLTETGTFDSAVSSLMAESIVQIENRGAVYVYGCCHQVYLPPTCYPIIGYVKE